MAEETNTNTPGEDQIAGDPGSSPGRNDAKKKNAGTEPSPSPSGEGRGEVTYPDGVTQDQVDAWKKKYGDGNVKMIEVPIPESDEFARCIIYNPRFHPDVRNVYAAGIKFYRQDEPIKQGELILNNCMLAGDERIKGTSGNDFIRLCAAMEAKDQFLFLSARTVDI